MEEKASRKCTQKNEKKNFRRKKQGDSVWASILKVSQKSRGKGNTQGNFFQSPPARKATSQLRRLARRSSLKAI